MCPERTRTGVARSERFELPTLGIEIRCSIQLSYERVRHDPEKCEAVFRKDHARKESRWTR
jgi:hypothetical protein